MYRERMQQIVRRLEVAKALGEGRANMCYSSNTVEGIYLQFRHVLELIATASLSINPGANEELLNRGRQAWNAGAILKAVKIVNPDHFYPKPVRLVKDKGDPFDVRGRYVGELKDFTGDYLTPDKFDTLYDVCSRFLHTPNPFRAKSAPRTRETDRNHWKRAPNWHKRIIELVTHHKFRPAWTQDKVFFLCHTVGESHEFHIDEFERMETPQTATASSK